MNKLPAERWRRIIGAQAGSGLSVVAFCRRAKVPPGSFYFWRRKLRDVVTFAEVRVSPAPAGEAREIELRLPGGRCVVVRAGFDQRTLLELLATLEHADCVAAESAGGMGGREEEPTR